MTQTWRTERRGQDGRMILASEAEGRLRQAQRLEHELAIATDALQRIVDSGAMGMPGIIARQALKDLDA